MQIKSTALFKGINEHSVRSLEKCLHITKQSYKKGETVCHYGYGESQIGIILSGRASIIRTDENGREFFAEHLPEGSTFSELFSYSRAAGDSIMVRASSNCTVAYMSYRRICSCELDCDSPCKLIGAIRKNLESMVLTHSRRLSERILILGYPSIREKLMCFFRFVSEEQSEKSEGATEQNELDLPFTWLELAAYLGVDRSAMMREVSYMKRDGLIECEAKHITIA